MKVKFQTSVIFSSKHQKPEVKQCGTCLQQNTEVIMQTLKKNKLWPLFMDGVQLPQG